MFGKYWLYSKNLSVQAEPGPVLVCAHLLDCLVRLQLVHKHSGRLVGSGQS